MILNLNAETLAAWVAAIAAILAVGTAIAIHLDSRGRARIDLRLSVWDTVADGLRLMEGNALQRPPSYHPTLELATVVVGNPGREGITLTEVGLEIRSPGIKRKHLRPVNFAPNPLPQDHTLQERTNGSAGPPLTRIEPNDCHSTAFDFWTAVDETFLGSPGLDSLRVRGYVVVAGRNRRYSRNSWTIWRNTLSALPDQRVRSLEDAILRALLVSHSKFGRAYLRPVDPERYEMAGFSAPRLARKARAAAHDGGLKSIDWEVIMNEGVWDHRRRVDLTMNEAVTHMWTREAAVHVWTQALRCRDGLR